MHMPKIGAEHENLSRLAGRWSGEETIHVTPFSPQEAKATAKVNARMDLGGFFLVTDHEQRRDGEISFRGHGVYGWDPRQERYTQHWFDTMGGDPGAPALGIWEGDKLTFQHAHHMGHSRYTYALLGDDAYRFTLEVSRDGRQWMLFLEGSYRREK